MKTTFKRKAFTLIELLIVIAIIGILFIVLVSKVDFATDKAKATGVQTDFRSFQVAFEQVARENSGFNTFGWDEGDKADPSLYAGRTPDGQTYTYANESKDRGDRVRNSYDAGDANLNGRQESGETWTGRKIYTETWTGIYTLENPATGTDKHANDNAVIDLENAINKNLDPKLHITIADHVDGTTLGAAADSGQDQGKVYYITMKNQAVDPWKTEYVGKYLTNASANSTTNSIDANKAPMNPQPMVGSLDRGAIIIYSKGANLELGSHEEIINGSVVVYVSLKDDERVDHNTAGQDDYSISTIYTFKNGYGEVISTTTGFSNNQTTNMAAGVVTLNNYNMLEGKNMSYDLGSPSIQAKFRVDAELAKFTNVKVDGSVVDSSKYSLRSGSTIIVFTTEYMQSLSLGNHSLEVEFTDGKSSTSFNVGGVVCSHLNSVWQNGYTPYGELQHSATYWCNDCNRSFMVVEDCDAFWSDGLMYIGNDQHASVRTCGICNVNGYTVNPVNCSYSRSFTSIGAGKHVSVEYCDVCGNEKASSRIESNCSGSATWAEGAGGGQHSIVEMCDDCGELKILYNEPCTFDGAMCTVCYQDINN